MLIIKEIIGKMDDTLCEADFYAKNAHHYKDTHPILADTYYKLGNDHLAHYMSLHTAVVAIINDHRRTKGEPPATMAAIWDYEHKKLIEDYEDIKKMLEHYR
jgi:hypothetical protein